MMRNDPTGRMVGFSLTEVMIILVILSVISAIVIGAVFGAAERARQRATMADMRTISKAIETYTVDHGHPPAASGSIVILEPFLRPYNTTIVPTRDHWGHAYAYDSAGLDYTIASFGKDGVDGLDVTPATRHEFDRDIVISNGRFVAAPKL